MDWHDWIHFAHVTAAVVWIGGGVMLCLVGLRTRQSQDDGVVGEFARLLSYAGLRVFTPAVVVVLVTGLWLVLAGTEFTLDQAWVLLALAAFAAAFAIGAVFLSRSALRLERVAAAGDLEAARGAIGQWLVGYVIVLAILVFAVWDMVFKPGGPAGT